MAIYTVEVKSIGTSSRDFATITLWGATVAGNINKGQIGDVFADSDFDERPVLSSAGAIDRPSTVPTLRAAAGQRPIIKPTTNGNILTVSNAQVHGMTIDGASQTSGIGIRVTGVRSILSECEVKNCSGDGIRFTALGIALFCLSHNNSGKGIVMEVNQSALVCCGAAKNGDTGLSGEFGPVSSMRSCWSLDNTGDDIDAVSLTDVRFMYISDTSITDQGTPTFPDDIFENQSSGSLGFTNFAGNDFTLAAGSALRKMGGLYSQVLLQSNSDLEHPQIGFDVFGNSLVPQFGDRFDVGPHQPSIATVTVTAPAAPVITAVVAGNLQVTVTLTGDAGKTHEVFFFTPGTTVPVSGGTRVGNGDIIITGLTNGITIDIVAATQADANTFGPPSTSVASTPVVTISIPVGQWPNLIDRIRDFYINSSDFLSWINVFDAGETTTDHVFLGYSPTNIKDLLSKGPVVVIHAGEHDVDNSGQQTSYNGTITVEVRHIWAEDDDTKDTHMLAYNKMAAIENALLRLDPFHATFGSAVMKISGRLTQPFSDADDQWVGEFLITLDWGPGE